MSRRSPADCFKLPITLATFDVTDDGLQPASMKCEAPERWRLGLLRAGRWHVVQIFQI
jgi:hypothetical protein